jgi:hypothetical protein
MRKLTPLALAIAGSLLASPSSYAQLETAKEEQKVERIEVTGSRIKGVDLEITDTPSANARASAANGYLVDVFGFGSSLSAADRTQMAAFAEIYAPLTDTIELQLAGRYDHYDDFGSTFNPKIGITWRPLDSLVMRASWATSFRAPSLTQAGVKLRTTTATFDCSASQTVSDLYCEGTGFTSNPNVLELDNAALQTEGITTYCHTGSYQVPCRTLTGGITDDLILIDKFIGVGEIAFSDHRSSQPTTDEIRKVASAAKVGDDLAINQVFAMGRQLVVAGKATVKGMFEK